MNSRAAEAARLESRAAEYVRLAAEADDDQVRRDKLLQAASARAQSARLLEAEAKAIPAAPETNWGVSTTFGAVGRTPAPVFTTGPR